MIVDFGFDLAARREPRLLKGLAWSLAAALVEALPYLELYRIITALYAGHADLSLVIEATVVLLLAAIALVLLKARANIENFSAVYRLTADARLAVADHLAKLPMGMFTASRRAVIAELLAGRFNLYQDVISHSWGLAIVNAGLPLFLWLLLLASDWRVAMVAAACVPLAFLAVPWSHRLLARATQQLAYVRNDAVTAIVDQIELAPELRQFDRDGLRQRRCEDLLHRLESQQMRSELAPGPALLTFAFLLQLGFALSATTAVFLFSTQRLDLATFVFVLVVGLRFCRGLTDLGINLAELRFAKATLDDIRALSATTALPEPAEGQNPGDASIAFDTVSFTYGDTDDVALHATTGHIKPGQMIALVGPSGAGKSTLAHLVARLWDVGSGAIRIGGVDVRQLDSETLNRTVAMVLQDVVLFEGTIADNIRLGRPDAPDADVEAAARAAYAHDFITRQADGYNTVLSAQDTRFSGGERQRLAIARALLKDAPILILDEATSSVDLDQEADIQAALSLLTQGRTVIVIAHRLWTVTTADEIWAIDRGEIVERGTHNELLTANGLYARLWDAQAQARSWQQREPVNSV